MENEVVALRFALPLRALMSYREITQKELSERTDVPQSVISNILTGEIKTPSIDVLLKLANGLGVFVDVLLYLAVNPKDLDFKGAILYDERRRALHREYPEEMKAVENQIQIQKMIDQSNGLLDDMKSHLMEAIGHKATKRRRPQIIERVKMDFAYSKRIAEFDRTVGLPVELGVNSVVVLKDQFCDSMSLDK